MNRERIETGIPGLDEILKGGFIARHSYLLVGAAGTGKTIFSLQWLHQGLEKKERCLYITLAEPADDVKKNVLNLGWKLNNLNIVDLSPAKTISESTKSNMVEEYHIFAPSEVEHLGIWEQIYQAIEQIKPQRVVIDSATQLRYLSTDEYQFRKQILRLVGTLNKLNITSILLFEPNELERETSVALAVDGILYLRMDISLSRVIGLRNLQIVKLRGSDFLSGYHSMQITNKGIYIYPHRIEKAGDTHPGQHIITSGIQKLDTLLDGGLESGTTTILSGPSGVGKSTLGLQFLANSSTENVRSIMYTFEESVNSVLKRSAGIGMHLKEKLDKGLLKIIRINPMEIHPDEFIEKLRYAVEHDDVKLIMIDSLRGYHLAMEQYGTLLSHVQNFVTYLNRKEVTTILVNEVEAITGNLKVTELGVSHLADNVLLLRYAEHEGQVIKIITCLKKRLSNFSPEIRLLQITAQGIDVSKKLNNLRGVLTGIPTTP